jgi:hypothetical protein
MAHNYGKDQDTSNSKPFPKPATSLQSRGKYSYKGAVQGDASWTGPVAVTGLLRAVVPYTIILFFIQLYSSYFFAHLFYPTYIY